VCAKIGKKSKPGIFILEGEGGNKSQAVAG
jgi:hypothetical protein